MLDGISGVSGVRAGLWAVIPLKAFSLGKSRLSDILSNPARRELNHTLFCETLHRVIGVFGASRTAIVTCDEEAAEIARGRGATYIAEVMPGELNRALRAACKRLAERGASACAVLPTDLPFATETDFKVFAGASEDGSWCIAPDRLAVGTNALIVPCADADAMRFGHGSFRLHVAAARRLHRNIVTVHRSGLAFDLDGPSDYAVYRAARTLQKA